MIVSRLKLECLSDEQLYDQLQQVQGRLGSSVEQPGDLATAQDLAHAINNRRTLTMALADLSRMGQE